MKIVLPPRQFEKEEEHYHINYYFKDNESYEIAITSINCLIRPTNLVTVSSNILDYNVLNPNQIIGCFGPYRAYQISDPIFYKINVPSLKNLIIKLSGFQPQNTIITLEIRKING